VLADIIAAVRPPAGGLVLEIGAGTGQLTAELLAAGFHVVAIEIEPRLVTHLHQRFAGNPKLRVVEGDARLLDLAEVLPREAEFVAVGNLPYFAANPIIRRILEGERRPYEAVFMVQREVGREIAAKPGHASLLAISVQVYAATELLFDVPPEAFDPPPAVHSSVVRLTLLDEPLVPRPRLEAFFTLVSKTFRNPRKQIHNALARETGLTADEAATVLAAAHIDPMRRAETLTVADWLALLAAREALRGG
jgi:16S rRNA (adenine1518-N6/adenine1519-N6)-dimethyltransferase